MTVAGDLVAKAQDWPGADKLAERLKKTIPPQFLEEGEEGGGVPPEVLQELQMQMQALQQENEQLKTDKTIEFEKLEVDKYNAQTQRIKALSDHEVDMNQMEQDAIKTILDGSVKLDEMELKKDDIEAKHELAGKKQESDAALRAEQAKAKMAAPSTPKAKSTPTSGNKSQ
jgi:vacuolar-type H+-ATPase subunit I/STV1